MGESVTLVTLTSLRDVLFMEQMSSLSLLSGLVAMPFPECGGQRSAVTGQMLRLALQKSGRGKNQGEVLPTLDMALFDWTDYEYMKPADTWPSSKKKGDSSFNGYMKL